tara:strand:+ start:2645 stop:4135 length:1491 start_codon:yes stop_codon:yes gene_type:complete
MIAQPNYSAAAASFIAAPKRLLIDGEWQSSSGDKSIPVYDPSNGEEIGSVVDASIADVDRAVLAARRAFDDRRWSGLPPYEREMTIRKLADLIEANASEFAELEAIDNGKSVAAAAQMDVPGAIAQLRYMAGWATRMEGDSVEPMLAPSGAFHGYTRREPVGVVALIVPWNFPLFFAALKLAPALAAGCTTVLKPAEQTSLTTLRFADLVLQAGFPAGVINIVTGAGSTAGEALVRHPGIDKISFTGSTQVGKGIARIAADTLTRITLELGGKSPMVVMPDVDIAATIQGVASGIYFNAGQICTAGSRVYAHRDVFDQLVDGVAAAATGLRLGPSLAPDTQMGPLVSARQRETVLAHIESASAEGASLVVGRDQPGGDGYYVAPAVIADVSPEMRVMREEIFGPVVCVSRFDDLDAVVKSANDTRYGLAASIWTRDVSAMHKLAGSIKAGTIWGNCHNAIDPAIPFGGYKESGLGREHGQDGPLAYTETKSVLIAL